MARPVVISERPTYYPYSCVQCGLNGPPREYFIDLGFVHQVFIPDFNLYLCNECWPSLATSVSNEITKWQMAHADWDSPEAVLPTYEWEEKLKIETEETENDGPDAAGESGQLSTDTEPTSDGTSLSVAGLSTDNNRDDQDTEPDNPESEHPDDESSTTSDDSDDDAAKQVFTAFFGESP
jgi:hypothetical protein